MKEFITAWQFLTRIRISKNHEITGEDLARAYLYFPLAGLIIGALLALLGYVSVFFFKPLTVVIVIVAAEILLTRGLHLYGFMDYCDGFFSGSERERILEIMKDSRVGSMGVLGCLVLLGLKTAFLYELAETTAFLPLVAATPILSRWTMVFVMAKYPYARAQGLGGLFRAGINSRHNLWVALYSAALILLILPWQLYTALAAAVPLILWVARRINDILGGHTGDTYGFMNEISGLLFIMAAVIVNIVFSYFS